MIPVRVAELRNCAPADLVPRRQSVYDYYQHLVDEQLKYHVSRLRRQRQLRPRRPKEFNYGQNIRSEIADEISDCRQRLFLGLATGVERLRVMETLPDDIEAYLRSEIRSQGSEHHREDRFDIIPPPSTNTTRPEHAKYKPLKRQPNTIRMDGEVPISILEIRSENAPYMPSNQQEQHDAFRGVDRQRDAQLLKDELARTEEERAILDRLEQETPYRRIAIEVGITEHKVRVTVDIFAERANLAPRDQRAAS